MHKLSLSLIFAIITIWLGACTQQSLDQDTVTTSPSPQPPVSLEKKESFQDKGRQEESIRAVDTVENEIRLATPGSPVAGSMKQDVSGKMLQSIRLPSEPVDRDNYAHFDDNPVKRVVEAPVSTFSIDVDTGAYPNVRRMLNNGQIPRKDAVRIEELVNYFSYDYAAPENKSTPFATLTEIAPSPWNEDALLLHIGIKGYEVAKDERPAANLVFLVDVSGSMNSADKLGLLKSSLKLLTKQLNKDDRIAIAVYAGAAGTVLESTPGDQRAKIIAALDGLQAGGSTNGGAGIRLAYNLAQQGFIKDGINRVIIATDGDFNVGTVNFEALKELAEEKRKTGIALTTLGYGTGNYNDHLMEQLADAGNGNYAYIDTLNEANKVLVEEMTSTLQTIAKDVKIQIEFNPAVVSQYRLVGYENRVLRNEDFNNDKIDAGEIGAGHSVTALYEIILADGGKAWLEPLRYQPQVANISQTEELAHLRIRYKEPDSDNSQLLEWPLQKQEIKKSLAGASDNFRFSAAVAGFGQLLRSGRMTENFAYDDVLKLARQARGDDPFGYRGEFIKLVSLADSLINPAQH